MSTRHPSALTGILALACALVLLAGAHVGASDMQAEFKGKIGNDPRGLLAILATAGHPARGGAERPRLAHRRYSARRSTRTPCPPCGGGTSGSCRSVSASS